MLPQSMPGIRRIYVVPCHRLPPRLMLAALTGGAVAMFRKSLTPVPFTGTPTLKWDVSVENGSRKEKTTLEFRSSIEIPEGMRQAFIVEGVNRKVYLIGTREPNYPVVEYSESTGEPAGSPAVRTYKITHTAIKSIIPVVL